jgi:hypothetical protein
MPKRCQEVTMEGHDVLHIPQGIVHQVTTIEEMSVHLTVSMARKQETWEWFVDEMLAHWEDYLASSPACSKLARSTFEHLRKNSVFGVLLYRSFPGSPPEREVGGEWSAAWQEAYSMVLRLYEAQLQARWEPVTAQCGEEVLDFLRNGQRTGLCLYPGRNRYPRQRTGLCLPVSLPLPAPMP